MLLPLFQLTVSLLLLFLRQFAHGYDYFGCSFYIGGIPYGSGHVLAFGREWFLAADRMVVTNLLIVHTL